MALVAAIEEAAFQAIQPYTGSIVARSIVRGAIGASGVTGSNLNAELVNSLLSALERGTRAFLADTHKANDCVTAAKAAVTSAAGVPSAFLKPAQSTSFSAGFVPATTLIMEAATGLSGVAWMGFGTTQPTIDRKRIDIREEFDIVTARGETKSMCEAIGFPALEQVKIATVVSELTRNIVQYAGTGYIDLIPLTQPKIGIEIVAADQGQGIPNINHVMSGSYESTTGMGVGLMGTNRLMDLFEVNTGATGTTITARRYVP